MSPFFRRCCVYTEFEISPLWQNLQNGLEQRKKRIVPGLTVWSSRSQLWTTELGATMRHVGHVASAGGSFLVFFHLGWLWRFRTWFRRRSSSDSKPVFAIIADRKAITCTVLPASKVRNLGRNGRICNLTLGKEKNECCRMNGKN